MQASLFALLALVAGAVPAGSACAAVAHPPAAPKTPADSSAARTLYVRTDGGSADQCSGLVDAPYRGNERTRACAWNHPFVALPPTRVELPVAPRMRGGDTLIIGPGSYMMGYGAPETSICSAEAAYDCIMQSPPAGPSPERPTRILGTGFDQGCKAPPQLWGTQRAYAVLQIHDSANVEVACLELTDHSSCIENHCHWEGRCSGEVDRCKRDAFPFGTWAENGLVADNARMITLSDINIHGLGNEGVRAGRLTDWTVHRLRIWANGFAGWDGDLGGDDTGDHGTMRFEQLEIAWSGCGERYPGGEIFGCWGQEEGGYGDGFGTGKTGGTWIFEDAHIHHNTQDGLDLLYLRGDGVVTMRRVHAEANAGNQLKATGNATVVDSIVDGNCTALRGVGNMREEDQCRAEGGAISFGLEDGKRSTVENTRITGEGGCLIVGAGGGADATMVLRNNTLIGGPRWDDKSRLACGYYLYESKGRVEASGNKISNVKASPDARAACSNQPDDSAAASVCRKLRRLRDLLVGNDEGPTAQREQ